MDAVLFILTRYGSELAITVQTANSLKYVPAAQTRCYRPQSLMTRSSNGLARSLIVIFYVLHVWRKVALRGQLCYRDPIGQCHQHDRCHILLPYLHIRSHRPSVLRNGKHIYFYRRHIRYAQSAAMRNPPLHAELCGEAGR